MWLATEPTVCDHLERVVPGTVPKQTTLKANNTVESPEDVARETSVGTSAKVIIEVPAIPGDVTTEVPAIPEDETIRKSSRPRKRKTFEN